MKETMRQGKIEKTTKKEVAKVVKSTKAIEIDDLHKDKRIITDATVRIKVERVYTGGSDSTSFEVKEDVSYSEILNLVNPIRKKI